MDVRYLIFALCSSVLCFLYIFLSILVIRQRRKYLIAYLTNEDKAFIARVRAHANFAEYVPLGLILMAVSIVLDIHVIFFAVLAVLFVLARCIHPYGLIKKEAKRQFGYRFFAMALTFSVLLLLAIFNMYKALMLWFNTAF